MNQMRLEMWGEGHSHSDWSDGYSSLSENTPYFSAYDQDFHFACDHLLVDVSPKLHEHDAPVTTTLSGLFRMNRDNMSEYRKEVLASGSSDHIAIDGIELTWKGSSDAFGATDRHHVLVRDQLENLPDTDFFRGASISNVLSELKHRGMKPFLAHINDAIPPAQLTGAEISGIEVRSDIERREDLLALQGIPAWDQWLTAGHRIALSAGSDAHQMDMWAGSGARNVVYPVSKERESIRAAVLDGHGYVSATWHNDIYQELGYRPVVPGAGSFTPWWMLNGPSNRATREEVRHLVDTLVDATISSKNARTSRHDHPQLAFDVHGASFGEEAEARGTMDIGFSVHMNVPVDLIRIWSDGAIVHEIHGDNVTTHFEGDLRLEARHHRYLRIEAAGRDESDHREYLMGNPIYLV